jgi:hypothetical protein
MEMMRRPPTWLRRIGWSHLSAGDSGDTVSLAPYGAVVLER